MESTFGQLGFCAVDGQASEFVRELLAGYGFFL